jgi:hypothetical protein
MEIRGYITNECKKSLTCCSSCSDILIDGKSLHEIITDELNLDPEESFLKKKEYPLMGIRYLVLDKDPGEGDISEIISNWIVKKLYTEYISGCYSEYTCGHGDYEYFFGEEGHSIGKELSGYINKYVLIEITDFRESQINQLLSE